MNNWGEGLSFLDIISMLSFLIGVENYSLNIEQSNQLDEHLREQDDKLLSKIILQNEEIIQQNEKLLSLLGDKK